MHRNGGYIINNQNQVKKLKDITCEQCGKTNGSEAVGNSWICEDCKVTTDSKDDTQVK